PASRRSMVPRLASVAQTSPRCAPSRRLARADGKERPVPDSAPGANVGALWAVERNSTRAPLLNSLRGTVNHPVTVPEIRARLLNALGFSLLAGQRRERERRPARPGRAPPSVLCANAVPAPATLADAQTLGKTGRKRQRPRGSLLRAAVEWCLPRSSRGGGNGSPRGSLRRSR